MGGGEVASRSICVRGCDAGLNWNSSSSSSSLSSSSLSHSLVASHNRMMVMMVSVSTTEMVATPAMGVAVKDCLVISSPPPV